MAIKKGGKSSLNKDNILLIDGRNLLYHSYMGSIKNDYLKENNINGILFFYIKLNKIIKNIKDKKSLIFIFDGDNSGMLRSAINPYYKSNREYYSLKTSIDYSTDKNHFKNQENILIEELKKLNYNVFKENVVEADDIIYKIIKDNPDKNFTIVSSDKDFYQLINDKVSIYNLTKNKIINVNNFLDLKMGHYENNVLLKSIIGDISDCIVGISGSGYKSISKIINIDIPFNKDFLLNKIKLYLKEKSLTNKKPLKWVINLNNNLDTFNQNIQLIDLRECLLTEIIKNKSFYLHNTNKVTIFALDTFLKQKYKKYFKECLQNYTIILNNLKQ